MKFDIITFGSATQDIVLKPKRLTSLKYDKSSNNKEVCFPFGSKIDVEDMMFYSGGGGTNTAVTFALQGFKTAFCGTVGKDLSGQKIINELKSFKINTKFVFTTDKKMTSHSVVILNNNEDRTILTYRGASELIDASVIPFKKLQTKWMYLAPLSGLLCDNFEKIVNFAFENKIKVAVNPGIAQLSLPNFAEIAKKIDILILNQEEASFLTKLPFKDEAGIFKKIDDLCPGITLMTKGGNGVLVSDGNFIYSAKPHVDRKVVDTTGAGDSFASGFLSEFIRTQDIEKSIQLGMANSEGCISQVGAKNGLLKKGQAFGGVEVLKEEINN